MIGNYFKIALRNFMRSKTVSMFSLLGLSAGMACCILSSIYVLDELSYDRHHENAHRIFRVAEEITTAGTTRQVAITPFSLGPTLVDDYPEVIDAVRFFRQIWSAKGMLVGNPPHLFFEKGVAWVDHNVFDLFDFPLSAGDPQSALMRSFCVVLSQEMADKYFDEQNPLGQTLSMGGQDFEVTGVLAATKQNTHLEFDFLATASLEPPPGRKWETHQYYTYLLLKDKDSATDLEAKFSSFVDRHMKSLNAVGFQAKPFLQPLTDINLYSDLEFEFSPNGDVRRVYLFIAIACAVLLLACVNFVSVSTARAPRRSREIGLRKVLGAQRRQLTAQFLFESVLFALVALSVALVVVHFTLPLCSAILGYDLTYDAVTHWKMAALFGGIVLLAGLLAGSYPALVLSSFQPVQTLKEHLAAGSSKATLRKVIVVFQFALAILLLIGTAVIYQQSRFLRQMDLGLDKEHVVVMPVPRNDSDLIERYRLSLSGYKQVVSASVSSAVPGRKTTAELFRPPLAHDDETQLLNVIYADYDFVQTFGLEIAEGRNFSKEIASDKTGAFILNEAAMKELGWTSVRQKELDEVDILKGEVVGVVRDFIFQPLHLSVSPLVIAMKRDWPNYFSIRIAPGNPADILTLLKTKWQETAPDEPFDYFFLDETFDEMYRTQDRLGQLLSVFAGFTVFIAGLGFLGLALQTVHSRLKEIGMRKILGGTTTSIIGLLSREFLGLIVLANIIAWPLAYYGARSWLDYFAYRIDIGFAPFVFGASLALLVAVVSTSYQVWHAARINPTQILQMQ